MAIGEYLKIKDLSKFDFLPCVDIVVNDLNHILTSYFKLDSNRSFKQNKIDLEISNISEEKQKSNSARMTNNFMYDNPLKKLNLVLDNKNIREKEESFRKSINDRKSVQYKSKELRFQQSEDNLVIHIKNNNLNNETEVDQNLLKLKPQKFEIVSSMSSRYSTHLSSAMDKFRGVNYELLDSAFRKSQKGNERKEKRLKTEEEITENIMAPQRGIIIKPEFKLKIIYLPLSEADFYYDNDTITAEKPLKKKEYYSQQSNLNTEGPSGLDERMIDGVQSGFDNSYRKTKSRYTNNTISVIKERTELDSSIQSMIFLKNNQEKKEEEESSCCTGPNAKCLIF